MTDTPSKALLAAWGACLRDERVEQGLNQVELAELANIDQARVSRAERGLASFACVLAMASALDIPLERLAGAGLERLARNEQVAS